MTKTLTLSNCVYQPGTSFDIFLKNENIFNLFLLSIAADDPYIEQQQKISMNTVTCQYVSYKGRFDIVYHPFAYTVVRAPYEVQT